MSFTFYLINIHDLHITILQKVLELKWPSYENQWGSKCIHRTPLLM